MKDIFWIDMCNDSTITGKDFIQILLDEESHDKLYGLPQSGYREQIDLGFVPVYKLGKKSKWTDFIYKGLGREKGIVFNEKVKNILKAESISKSHLNPIEIIDYKLNKKKYYWLIFKPNSNSELINFKESTFEIYKRTTLTDVVSFRNFEKYYTFAKTKCRGGIRMKPKQIVLHTNNLPDLFSLPIDTRIYLSSQLASKIKENEITGLEIIEKPRYLTLE